MKRFWTRTETNATDQGYVILLDAKQVNLPGGVLTLPFVALAEAIAGEWAVVGETFAPDDLPLTRLASTALHYVPPNRAHIIAQIAAFGANDLLCYRADDGTDLAARQDGVWQPWLDWAERELGVRLAVTKEIVPIAQPVKGVEILCCRLEMMTAFQLAGLGVIVPALGSLILGLAVASGTLATDQACELAQLEDAWQEQRWGIDEEVLNRREKIREDVAVAVRFMVLCSS